MSDMRHPRCGVLLRRRHKPPESARACWPRVTAPSLSSVLKTSWGTGPCRSKTRIVRTRGTVRARIRASDGAVSLRRTHVMLDPDIDLARRARKWVEETMRAQGLPVHVADPVVLRR